MLFRSQSAEAFSGCTLLKKAEFTGDVADFYAADEEGATFPDGCTLNIPSTAKNLRKEWEQKATQSQPASSDSGSSTDDDVSAKDQPYYWTQALTEKEYKGNGNMADITFMFDTDRLSVYINGRLLGEYDYQADRNDEDQSIQTDIYCRNGRISELHYSRGYKSDGQLTAILTKDDGSTQELKFNTGSEEKLYIINDDGDTYPHFEF